MLRLFQCGKNTVLNGRLTFGEIDKAGQSKAALDTAFPIKIGKQKRNGSILSIGRERESWQDLCRVPADIRRSTLFPKLQNPL